MNKVGSGQHALLANVCPFPQVMTSNALLSIRAVYIP